MAKEQLIVLIIIFLVAIGEARCTPLGMWGCERYEDCCWSPRGMTCQWLPGQRTGLCTEHTCLARGNFCNYDYECCSRLCFAGRYAQAGGVCK